MLRFDQKDIGGIVPNAGGCGDAREIAIQPRDSFMRVRQGHAIRPARRQGDGDRSEVQRQHQATPNKAIEIAMVMQVRLRTRRRYNREQVDSYRGRIATPTGEAAPAKHADQRLSEQYSAPLLLPLRSSAIR